jgi:hypothetical protein
MVETKSTDTEKMFEPLGEDQLHPENSDFVSDDSNVAFLVSIWILAIMYSLLFFFSLARYATLNYTYKFIDP